MKVVQINSVYNYGSTGRIVMDLHREMQSRGIDSKVVYGYGKQYSENEYRMQSMLELKYNIARGRITGRHGYYNKNATRKMLHWLKAFDPDIIHLHNIHGYYINVPMLFEYIKEYHKKVVWTFHDCWPFTGHCAYFDMYHCTNWKEGCKKCPAWNEYKIICGDCSKKNWIEKRRMFTNIKDMNIITPSDWLGSLTKQSFLKEYPVYTIHNGIDIKKFKYTESDIAEKIGINGKKIILGIVPDLDGTKGGRYLVELAKTLGNDYAVVLLSTVTKEKLPDNVYILPRTNTVEELAKIYSMADVFVNPTLQDNYPTVNLEATACGTPVVTFDTGGSPEGVMDGFGEVVEQKNMEELVNAVKKWENKQIKLEKDVVSMIDKTCFAEKYMKIYQTLYNK